MKKSILIFAFIFCLISGYAQGYFAKWRINLSGGIGYDVENTSEDEKQMLDLGFSRSKVTNLIDDLKLGGQGNTDVHYLLNKNFGIGLKYIFFKNDGKITETYLFTSSSGYDMIQISAKQKDIINYVGPSIHLRTALRDSKFAISTTLSGGYTYYKSDEDAYIITATGLPTEFISLEQGTQTSLDRVELTPSGSVFGMSAGVGLEYFITQQIAVGVDVGYFYSSLNNIKIDYMGQELTLKQMNNGKDAIISRLDFSLGIKCYF
jgi:opacity protein-like surface antigen